MAEDRALWGGRTAPISELSDEFQTTVQIRYLGTGGFLIRRGHDVILTAPFFSNPNVVRLSGFRLGPKPCAIDLGLAAVDADLADVKAVLVGHAHYDHLMDLPLVHERLCARAKTAPRVYGNSTARHILGVKGAIATEHLVALDAKACAYEEPDPDSRWERIPGTGSNPHPEAGGIRVLALTSAHSAQLPFGLHLWKGEVAKPGAHLPGNVWGWKEGKTLAYLIDFLRKDGSVAFRIHYADSAASAPNGFIPKLLPWRTPDLAILCLGAYGQVKDYPGALLANVRPHNIIVGHWESFFRPAHKTPRSIPLSPPREFLERLEKTEELPADVQYWMLAPRTLLRFPSTRRDEERACTKPCGPE